MFQFHGGGRGVTGGREVPIKRGFIHNRLYGSCKDEVFSDSEPVLTDVHPVCLSLFLDKLLKCTPTDTNTLDPNTLSLFYLSNVDVF